MGQNHVSADFKATGIVQRETHVAAPLKPKLWKLLTAIIKQLWNLIFFSKSIELMDEAHSLLYQRIVGKSTLGFRSEWKTHLWKDCIQHVTQWQVDLFSLSVQRQLKETLKVWSVTGGISIQCDADRQVAPWEGNKALPVKAGEQKYVLGKFLHGNRGCNLRILVTSGWSSPWRLQQPLLKREHIQQLLCTHDNTKLAWWKCQLGYHKQKFFIRSSGLHGEVAVVLDLFSWWTLPELTETEALKWHYKSMGRIARSFLYSTEMDELFIIQILIFSWINFWGLCCLGFSLFIY